jgi:hypothetical protein
LAVTFLVALAGISFTAVGATLLFRSRKSTVTEQPATPSARPAPQTARQDDAIYQNNKLVARVLDPAIDWDSKEIQFGEIYNSDPLLLPEECEFQKYRIMIQRVAFASRVEREAPEKGRILRGVAAEILGYREQ